MVIIYMMALDTSSPSLGGGATRRKRSYAAPSCSDLMARWVISRNQFMA